MGLAVGTICRGAFTVFIRVVPAFPPISNKFLEEDLLKDSASHSVNSFSRELTSRGSSMKFHI